MKIAIVGKMCSGKSTLANTIKIIDPSYEIYSFGNGIKDIAYNYFNMEGKDRSLLINIATKMKEIDEDIWIKYLMKHINNENCIIDDVRHQNELDYLIKHNWKIIHLHIDKNTQESRLKKIYPKNYRDHLNNINDISENCDSLKYPKGYNVLHINTTEDYHKINMSIHSLLNK